MAALIVLAVVALLVLVGGACLLVLASHVGKAGQPWYAVGGAALLIAGFVLGVWAVLAAGGWVGAP